MKWFLSILCLWLGSTTWGVELNQLENVHLRNRALFVTDQAGLFTPEQTAALNQAAREIMDQTSTEVAIVTVDQVPEGSNVDDFATQLFEKWGLGKSDKDNGLLLLISPGDRRAVIRTGYGVEGIIPDIVAGRIIRNDMIPHFKNGDYGTGTLQGFNLIKSALLDPNVAQELKSKYGNDLPQANGEIDFLTLYLWFCVIAAGLMLLFVIFETRASRSAEQVLRYRRLKSLKSTALFVSFITLGLGLIPYFLLSNTLHKVRRGKRLCPHCQTKMELIDEETDNDYLTPAQDTEEKLGSVDYDVWKCPTCETLEIFPYENTESEYKVCPKCGSKALTRAKSIVVVPPTTTSPGVVRDIYECRNCHNHINHDRKTPPKTNAAAGLAAAAILGGMAAGRGGGGGFSGGSFGGGSTGGGGAGGSW